MSRAAIERDARIGEIGPRLLLGVLTRMPLNMSAYDWATGAGHFVPRRDDQKTPRFIQRFSCASLEHGHYADGNKS